MTQNANSRRRALVTGASAGIGQAFAQRLARDGYDLIVVARRRERLEALAEQLRAQHGAQVEVLAANLAHHADLQVVERRISDTTIDMLVNNAGFGGYMPFVELPPERAEELIHLQVLAVTRLTRAALPGMIARAHGDIINVSSRLAFSAPLSSPPLPKRAVYAATKAYINTFTQIVADEVKDSGVRVQVLCPGVVRTEFHQIVGADPSRFPPNIVMSAEDVVTAALAGLQLGEVVCIPSLDDAALLAQNDESKRKLLMQSNMSQLAARYQT